jgi:hypothetical protein
VEGEVAMGQMTFEEFCNAPLQYVSGMSADWGAHRLYRNDCLGVQQEIVTDRKRYGDIYGGWKDGKVSFFLEGDSREFQNAAELYVAYMERICGVIND